MGFSRYTFTPKVAGQTRLATSLANTRIYNGIIDGTIPFTTQILKEGQRLDHIAANAYGSADLWWVIAAASGIGWGLQCPPGTILRVPKSAGQILEYIR